jgi:cation diffusion facilitator family transporter
MAAAHPPADRHDHRFDAGNQAAERSTRAVMAITAVMMVVEIVAGWWFNSMALLADGWHMSSHAGAIGVSAFAYAASRRYAGDPRFAFGTWKIEVLGGFASALFLLGVALLMVVGSVERLVSPAAIAYREALLVAAVGLVVNIVCAVILGRAHEDGGHAHGEADGHHHDLNLRSAYLHVVADAATSVFAMVALSGGWVYGWSWLDPVMGIVGAVLVGSWARGLLAETGVVLLDREMDHPVVAEIREAVERRGRAVAAHIVDLHVWRVGRHAYACAMTVTALDPALTPADVRAWLAAHAEIRHVTIEIQQGSDSTANWGQTPIAAAGQAPRAQLESDPDS